MYKNNETESLIDKRIKALQNDISYSWKQTSEIIDIIYRTALADLKDGTYEKLTSTKSENIVKNEIPKKEKVENSAPSKKEKITASVIKSLKTELEKIKNENKRLLSQIDDINSQTETRSFKSGQIYTLKYALSILDENDRIDSYNILKDKYSSLQFTLKPNENKQNPWL